MDPGTALLWINIALGSIGIVGAAHSAYRGTIRDAVRAIKIVPEIEEDVDRMESKVDKNTDAVLALVDSQSDDRVQPDADRIKDELRREPDEDRFVDRTRDVGD